MDKQSKPDKKTKLLNDGQLRFILPESERLEFTAICDRNETTASLQLRKFIRQYIANNKE
jgi:hypothetical protein